MILDPLPALRAYLAADAGVIAIAGTRVYSGEMPQAESDLQPRAAVVVSSAGGPGKRDWTQLSRVTVDVRSYNTTPYYARKLQLAVHEALEALHRRVSMAVLLHSATEETGPLELRDPDTKWPFVFQTYQLLAAEVAAA